MPPLSCEGSSAYDMENLHADAADRAEQAYYGNKPDGNCGCGMASSERHAERAVLNKAVASRFRSIRRICM